MTFEVRFLPEARETFEEIVGQLRQRWGDSFVLKFKGRVSKAIHTISNSPFIYPVIEETTGVRKYVLHKNCSMLYHVDDNIVEVICFWDNRQDPLFY